MPVRGRTAGNAGKGSSWCPRALRLRLYARDGWRCVWCKATVGYIGRGAKASHVVTLDHVIPRSAGGTDTPSNLVTACMHCNRVRGNLSAVDFARVLGCEAYPEGEDKFFAERWALHVLERVLRAVCLPLPGVDVGDDNRGGDGVASDDARAEARR